MTGGTEAARPDGTANRPVLNNQANGSRSEINNSAADMCPICQLREPSAETRWLANAHPPDGAAPGPCIGR